MIKRTEIIRLARTWIGTKWVHCGRSVAGIDCVGLVTAVAREVGATTHDLLSYSTSPDGVTLVRELRAAGSIEIDPEDALPGDMLVFWMRKNKFAQHVGFLARHPSMPEVDSLIHTYASVGAVVEHALDDRWRDRICFAFSLPGVEPTWQH